MVYLVKMLNLALFFLQFLVGTYLAMSAVVCLNLYIALMSDTFARVYENARANAVMQQAMQILNIERTLKKIKLIKIKKFIASECAPQVCSPFGLFVIRKTTFKQEF